MKTKILINLDFKNQNVVQNNAIFTCFFTFISLKDRKIPIIWLYSKGKKKIDLIINDVTSIVIILVFWYRYSTLVRIRVWVFSSFFIHSFFLSFFLSWFFIGLVHTGPNQMMSNASDEHQRVGWGGGISSWMLTFFCVLAVVIFASSSNHQRRRISSH